MRERLGEAGATTRVVNVGRRAAGAVRLKVPPAVARAVAAPALRVLASSWRFTVAHEERWRVLRDARAADVFLLWHEALLPLLWHHRNTALPSW